MDEYLYRRLGRLMKTRRRLLDMTQAEVAARCGTTFQQIQKYESGLTAISVGRLVQLAEALQMPVCSLLESALRPPAPTNPVSAAKDAGERAPSTGD